MRNEKQKEAVEEGEGKAEEEEEGEEGEDERGEEEEEEERKGKLTNGEIGKERIRGIDVET